MTLVSNAKPYTSPSHPQANTRYWTRQCEHASVSTLPRVKAMQLVSSSNYPAENLHLWCARLPQADLQPPPFVPRTLQITSHEANNLQ
jgi:hypothetical protein